MLAANEPRRRPKRLSRPTDTAASRGNVVLSCGGGNHAGTCRLRGGAEGIRTDGHRGRGEISSQPSLQQSMRAACSRPAPSRSRSTPTPRCSLSGAGRRRCRARLAVRPIEVGAAATQPTAEGFSRERSFADCVSALTPLSSVVELLIARLGRDDLELGGRQHKSTELEAPATGLMDDLPVVRRDVTQRVDLIVMLTVGKGGAARAPMCAATLANPAALSSTQVARLAAHR